MLSIRPFIRPVAVAVALALCAAPVAAHAEGSDKGAEAKKERKFPMPSESFNKMVERRISQARARMLQVIENNPMVTEAMRAQIKKDFDDGAAAVRALAAKVKADGTVTKDEAEKVRDLANELKEKAREKYMPWTAGEKPTVRPKIKVKHTK
jgi:hypothetical protein